MAAKNLWTDQLVVLRLAFECLGSILDCNEPTSALSSGSISATFWRCGRQVTRRCPSVIGIMSRKAITFGAERTRQQFGCTLLTSGFEGIHESKDAEDCGDIEVDGEHGYVDAMLQNGHDIG